MTLLGIDYGDRYVGCAISEGAVAAPLRVIQADQSLMSQLATIIGEHHVERIVVGMPLSLSGNENERTTATKMFIDRLQESTKVRVVTIDERLTTHEARKQSTRVRYDAHAAAIILQAYLDAEFPSHTL